jgi:hypothetical protein
VLTSQAPLGFSIRHAFKKVGHGITSVGKEAGHLAVKGAKLNLKLIALPTMELEKHVLAPILHTVLTPVRHKVDTLKDRRAKKLAWDNRKSTVPTQAERVQAKAWAKSYLKREKPPFGLMLSLLAGPPLYGVPEPAMDFGSGGFGDPTTAAVIASVPTLLAIMASILKRSEKNGEAPAGGHGGGGGGAAPAAPDPAGTVDLTPAQDAADGGAGAGGDAGADDGSGGGGGGKKGKHGGHGGGGGGGGGSGKMLGGLTKKQLMIGGAVVGGIVLLSLLMPKKS